MSDFSRRTVVRGAAWTVPVVAVATQAPAFAVSPPPPPPPPSVDFAGACGNTGATQKGCGGKFTLQVPLKVQNTTGVPIVFQITTMYVRNDDTVPGAGPAASGTYSGVRGIFSTPNFDMPENVPGGENDCTAVATSDCLGGVNNGTIVVQPGTQYFWIESVTTGDASKFTARIEYRLLTTDCTPLSGPFVASTPTAISPENCNG